MIPIVELSPEKRLLIDRETTTISIVLGLFMVYSVSVMILGREFTESIKEPGISWVTPLLIISIVLTTVVFALVRLSKYVPFKIIRASRIISTLGTLSVFSMAIVGFLVVENKIYILPFSLAVLCAAAMFVSARYFFMIKAPLPGGSTVEVVVNIEIMSKDARQKSRDRTVGLNVLGLFAIGLLCDLFSSGLINWNQSRSAATLGPIWMFFSIFLVIITTVMVVFSEYLPRLGIRKGFRIAFLSGVPVIWMLVDELKGTSSNPLVTSTLYGIFLLGIVCSLSHFHKIKVHLAYKDSTQKTPA